MTTTPLITLAVVLFATLGLDLWARRELSALRRELKRHEQGQAIKRRVLAEAAKLREV